MPSEYQINSKWLGNLFASDAETRREEVKAELDAEKGHDLSELLSEAVSLVGSHTFCMLAADHCIMSDKHAQSQLLSLY